jgi:signal transduction histidine kinase
MIRYEPDVTVTPVAAWGAVDEHPAWPDPWPTDEVDPATMVARTRRAVRIDWSDVTGTIATVLGDVGIRSSVGSPILVDGRLWGSLAVHTRRRRPFPPDTESRLENFTELVATAISNIEARAELAASRTRIVAAADEERRRVVRDLHDGAQQRLVHTIITLKQAGRALQNEAEDLPALLTEALDQAERATAELEATAYFVVAEALTNVAKHAHARRATVTARAEDGTFRVEVGDDGVGGARPGGNGLLGMADRLAALGGRLRIESPATGGTLITADFPLTS